jgi:hypothetical protein
MSPDLLNTILRVVGVTVIAFGHAQVVPQPWSQIIGEIGAALLLLTKTKPGDISPGDIADTHVPLSSLPPGMVDTLKTLPVK